jgi:uncharacterized protein YciI
VKRTTAIAALLSCLGLALAVGPRLRAADPAPEYEMTTYYVAFLQKGPAWSAEETPERAKIQEGHMANIRKMAETGKLLVAGPFTDDGDLRGLFVFRTGTLEEAKAMAEQDPAVKAGRLRLEWHPWFAAKNITVTATSKPAEPAKPN